MVVSVTVHFLRGTDKSDQLKGIILLHVAHLTHMTYAPFSS